MIFSSTVLYLIFLNQINGQQMELVASHVLCRHGDRTPLRTFPADPTKEKDWPNGFGQLTATGIEQHHRLGEFLRTRYRSLLNSTYIPNEIYVRSADNDRTLMSAESNLIGLYPLRNISNDKVPIQPIPIHTVSNNQDFLLDKNACPRYNQVRDEIQHSDEVKRINERYKDFFQKLQIWTNVTNLTIPSVWSIADTIFIEHIYNKTPSWADDNVRKNLSDISELYFHLIYSNNDTKRLLGGPLTQDIWMNMNDLKQGKSFRKVKMYSAHDTTIITVLFFLGIDCLHRPQYASALFIDLYKQNSTYFVKVEYLNVTDSNVSYPYILNGCPAIECPFEKFTALYQPKFPQNIDIECAKKSPPIPSSDGVNRKLIVISVVIILIIIISLIFLCIFLRRREHDTPLLSSD